MIKNLDKYTLTKQSIGKIDTYMVLPECYGKFLSDLNNEDELIDDLKGINDKIIESIRKHTAFIVQTVGNIKSVRLYLAINHNSYLSARWAWDSMMCLQIGGNYYPVHYISGWRCVDCMGDNGEVLVPLVDAEPDYFFGIDRKVIYEKEPTVFHPLFCKYCGHLMSGRLLKV